MMTRTWMLFGALLASPAWAQSPAPGAPTQTALSRQAFDLSNDSIKKILRDTVATQAVPVQTVEAVSVERKPFADLEYSSPVEAPPRESTPPQRIATAPSNGLISAIFDTVVETLVDEVLGEVFDDQTEGRWQYKELLSCESREYQERSADTHEPCSSMSHGAMVRVNDPPPYVPPRKP